MGSITEEVFKLCGFLVYRLDSTDEFEDVVAAATDMAFDGNLPVAILLGQRLIGRKKWVR
jgi:hypothetical protein